MRLNRIQDIGSGIDEFQGLLRFTERQREARALVRQLGQSLSFAGQDRVRLVDRKSYDASYRVVFTKVSHLFFNRDQIFVARKLSGNLKEFLDGRLDTIGVAGGNVRSFGGLHEIPHQILKQRFYVLDFLEVTLGEDAAVGYIRRK